jgi:hypothetical protein
LPKERWPPSQAEKLAIAKPIPESSLPRPRSPSRRANQERMCRTSGRVAERVHGADATAAAADVCPVRHSGKRRYDAAFTVTSAGLPGVQRDFTSFSSAVLQIEDARIYAGFHFRFSCVDGATLGAAVAQYVLRNTALPNHGRDLGQSG